MKRKKRKVTDKDIIAKPALLFEINKIDSLRDRALVSFIYMSGCRISEILGGQKIYKNYLKANNRFILEDGQRKYDGIETKEYAALTRENIEFMPEQKLMLIWEVPCLKRRETMPKRNIPIYIPLVPEFFNIFKQHWDTLIHGQKLFDITRQRAWQIVNTKMGMFNHFLIHERITHLVSQQGFTDHELKQFRGWSSTIPANSYVHLAWQDIARKQGANMDTETIK